MLSGLSRRDFGTFFSVLALSIATILAFSANAKAASIGVSSTTVAAGSSVVITGDCSRSDSEYVLYFDPAGTNQSNQITLDTVDNNGEFQFNYVIPSDTVAANYDIVVFCSDEQDDIITITVNEPTEPEVIPTEEKPIPQPKPAPATPAYQEHTASGK